MIIVTGGSGFIGTHVCEYLEGKGRRLKIIDIAAPPAGSKAEFQKTSVLELEALKKQFKGAEAVIHLAAQVDIQASLASPAHDFQVNAIGTINVLEAARANGIKKVAYASSAAVYGNPLKVPVAETHPTAPLSPYGTSKLSAEHFVLMYNRLHGMENVALRLFNAYGKLQNPKSPYAGVITKFASSLRASTSPIIYGDGKQTRDFIHASDVAAAFERALGTQGFDASINIGSGRETSVISLFEKMAEISGKMIKPEFRPEREGEIKRSVADISMAKKRLGFEPKVGLDEGLAGLLK